MMPNTRIEDNAKGEFECSLESPATNARSPTISHILANSSAQASLSMQDSSQRARQFSSATGQCVQFSVGSYQQPNYNSMMLEMYQRNLFERLVMSAAAAAASAVVAATNGVQQPANGSGKRKRKRKRRRRNKKSQSLANIGITQGKTSLS